MTVMISDDMVVSETVNDPPFPLHHARIGYQSFATRDKVYASSSQADFPAEATANPLTYDQWRPSELPATWTLDYGEAFDADYIGISEHSFDINRCTVTVQYSTDGQTWVDVVSLSPGNKLPIMILFQKITARYWRLKIEGNAPPRIGVIFIGRVLEMQRSIYGGHRPGRLNSRLKRIATESEGGQALGMTKVRKRSVESFDWEYLKADWVRETFKDFIDYAEDGYFFIAWNPEEYPKDVIYGWATGEIPVEVENMGESDFQRASMTVQGLGNE